MKKNERPRDECGVFAIYKHAEAPILTYFGLYALQHRGQESAGIVVADEDKHIISHKGMGLVSDVFKREDLNSLEGGSAIGHVRYSTTGTSNLANAQPFVVHHSGRSYAVAHNGNLVNAHLLKKELEAQGSIFQTTMDSEIFLHLLIKNFPPQKGQGGLEKALVNTVSRLKGAFSLVALTSKGEVIGIKDPNGFRPLCLGKHKGHYVLASETCALARPDSTINGKNVYAVRKAHGKRLAEEAPVEADIVIPFPDSGNYAAIGYSEASGIPLEMAMIRNHYVGRSFIQPTQSMRDFSVRIKLNPVKEVLEGKDIIIVDDSIIRGTTAKTRVRALRDLGVRKVHMRISCPPHRFPCYYGIDFSTKGELIAAKKTLEELREYLNLDSLHYLSIEGMLEATGVENPEDFFCKACFSGSYPVHIDGKLSKDCLEGK
jgi:amidophosphoribosyltransferase